MALSRVTWIHWLLVVVACFEHATPSYADDSLPDLLASQVTIRRDTWGVPHVLAKSEEAVYFGQGYACAEDHCLMMARNYLRARGEEAAHFGEAFAAGDFLTRRVRIHETTREAFPKLPPWVRRNLDAYALGYTRYVAKHRDQLPEWVPRATGVGVLASSRHALILNFSTDPAVRRRFHDLGVRAPTGPAAGKAQGISSTDDPYRPSHAIGSNMWAIHKDRSASGKALLLGNPHLDWSGDVLHEAHLTVPGRLNVMGATLVGTPGLTIGFNDTLGWSLTVNAHDSDDLYELKLSGDGTSYLYDGRPLPLHRDELTIQVKTKAGLEPRTLEALRSHYGPTVKTQGVRASRGSRRISTSAATSNRCS